MSAKYSVVIKEFVDTTHFGPGETVVALDLADNIGWAEYLNDVGEAFFSLPQSDPKLAYMLDSVDKGHHCHIYRNGELVWGGWLGESDETQYDVVFTAYSYVSGYYHYMMDWDRKWTGIAASTIISDAASYARYKTKSRVGWITLGTIEDLWIVSGGPDALSLPLYRATYKRVLNVFREITAYAMSDTHNHVVFEVTPDGTFNLWHNRATSINDARWQYGNGIVRAYRRIRMPVDKRNAILAVGSSPKSTELLYTASESTDTDANGLKQEPIYLSWVRDLGQLTNVAKLRLRRALRVDTDLYLTFSKDSIIPYRATDAPFTLGDNVQFNMNNGVTSMDGSTEVKTIVGQQVIIVRGTENVRLLLTDAI